MTSLLAKEKQRTKRLSHSDETLLAFIDQTAIDTLFQRLEARGKKIYDPTKYYSLGVGLARTGYLLLSRYEGSTAEEIRFLITLRK